MEVFEQPIQTSLFPKRQHDMDGGRKLQQDAERLIAGDSADMPNGGRLVVNVRDTSVGIFRVEDRLYAYFSVCAHRDGPACQGKILPRVVEVIDEDKRQHGQAWDDTDPHVICPWHGYEYLIKAGEHAVTSGIKLSEVDVEETDGVIYVTV